MDKLVTVRTFSSSQDFEMVKSYLESFGIECFGRDEIINRSYFSNVNGGVKLDVRAEQAEEAVKLLVEGGYLKAEDFELSPEMKWMEKLLSFFHKKYFFFNNYLTSTSPNYYSIALTYGRETNEKIGERHRHIWSK